MTRYTEGECPICGNAMGDNPALYAMGWHVPVCSNDCRIRAIRLLMTFSPIDEYAGPDGLEEHQGGKTD